MAMECMVRGRELFARKKKRRSEPTPHFCTVDAHMLIRDVSLDAKAKSILCAELIMTPVGIIGAMVGMLR